MSNTTFNYDAVADRYDEWYATPQGKAIDRLEKESFLKHLSKIPKKTVIVEAGAGTGHWSQFMVAQGYMVVGIDISKKMLEKAVAKEIPYTIFLKSDITNLPFLDNSVDAVVAITSLEFTSNPKKTLMEFYRMLKPSGRLIVGTLNKNGSMRKWRKGNPLFESARYFSHDTLLLALEQFGEPEISGSVLMPNLEAQPEEIKKAETDASVSALNQYGNFLVGSVEKTK